MATLIVLFTAAAVLQLANWYLVATAVRRIGDAASTGRGHTEAISVVVAVHNGATDLPDLIACLGAQTHQNFELIVIDDQSTDATREIVTTIAENDTRTRLLESRGRGKKDALSVGIAAASHDLLALTDADCRPESGWLQAIVQRQNGTNESVVVGYAPYRSRPGLLNRLVRYETLHTALLMATTIRMGRPYMATGRNVSYRKSTFGRVGGFRPAEDLLSGDDDLFVQAAASQGIPVRFMDDENSFVYSEAPSGLKEWIRQKHRHLSTGRRYRRASSLLLLLYHATALLCWLAPAVLGWMGIVFLGARLIPGQLVVSKACRKLLEQGLSPYFVPLDLMFQLYLVFVAPVAWFRPPKRW